MKRILTVIFGLVSLYSLMLIWTELQGGQECVRGFFSDIKTGVDYPLPARTLFGINTTLTVVILTGCAVLFAVCAEYSRLQGPRKHRAFFHWSQVVFFVYLAADERLMIHEKAAAVLCVKDALLIIGLGMVELALLYYAGRVTGLAWRIRGWLLAAGAAFAVMIFIDALVPESTPGRLAIEDLSKVWAAVFLLCFSWQYCLHLISPSVQQASEGG